MNLVKAQELVKGMPQQELEKYANGFAPDFIPPWLATGEMQAQMKRKQQMQAMQGAAQGPQTSVKEQIEKNAGLMQAAQSAPPMPQMQPQEQPQQQPTMLEEGGIARLPVNFNFGGGGIVAFDKGGDVDAARAAAKQAQEQLRVYGLAKRLNDPEGYQTAQDALAKTQEVLAAAEAEYAKEMSASGVDRAATKLGSLKDLPAYQSAMRTAEQNKAVSSGADMGMPTDVGMPANTDVSILRQPIPGARPQGLPGALPAAPRAERPPAPPVVSSPAAPSVPNIPGLNDPAAQSAVSTAMKAPNQAELIAEEQARLKAMGIEGKYGADQETRIQAARDLYEKSRPSGLDDMIRVFGQAGQYKGLSGTGPAYTALKAQQRADDMARLQKENEQYNAVDIARRAEGISQADKVGTAMGKGRETAATAASQMLGHQMTAGTSLANQASSNAVQMQIAKERNLNALEVQRIQSAAANRPGETERLLSQYGALKAKDPTAAEQMLQDIERIKTGQRGATAQEKLMIQRQALAEKDDAYKQASQQFYFTKDAEKKAQAQTIMQDIERRHGIMPDAPSNIQSLVNQYAK